MKLAFYAWLIFALATLVVSIMWSQPPHGEADRDLILRMLLGAAGCAALALVFFLGQFVGAIIAGGQGVK